MGSTGPDPDSGPLHITPDLLADLQAGLLDDATAARVRRQARTDPEAARVLAGLDTVRRRLAELGTDERSAPEVPADVTAAMAQALRTAPQPAPPPSGHALARPRLSRVQWAGLVVGVCAVAAAVVLGVLTLTGAPGPAFPPGPTAEQITVERPAGFPLSDEELRDALTQPPDLGPLTDPQRRASCLTGLGRSPTEEVLGGRLLEVSGRPGVLLLLPGGASEQLSAVVVEPTCSVSRTGLLAETVLARQ
ncbi:hypothetical protein [Mycolicibacterium sp. CR10]|uniref:hypothetical protein n=1 Tax=Mycolicibacterium sp. CR10 TaxID=2562314 RepID=UPI0010C0E6A9|nr:hypothetical protein [Mycolicibacterium sp. CR10]